MATIQGEGFKNGGFATIIVDGVRYTPEQIADALVGKGDGMTDYEFRAFGPDAEGPQKTEYHRLRSDNAARAKAATLARQTGGPVDLARNVKGDWDQRYMTTASPSEHHASGVRFERLDN